jgi:hypothetical protein
MGKAAQKEKENKNPVQKCFYHVIKFDPTKLNNHGTLQKYNSLKYFKFQNGIKDLTIHFLGIFPSSYKLILDSRG